MRELYTEIEILASPREVWEILMDFAQYPEWNPFIKRVEGKPEKDAKLSVLLQPPEGKGKTFEPRILKVEPMQEFRWLGKLILPRVFDGEHIFQIQPIEEDRVKFIQKEQFRGVLVPVFWKMLNKSIRPGFVEMNSALKKKAEA
jgi:hypothetical protein